MNTFISAVFSLAIFTSHANANENNFTFDVPHMLEQAEAANIKHSYDGSWEYFVGGGAASFDCNGDRMPDMFLAGGSSPAQLFINTSKAGAPLQFESKDIGLGKRQLQKVTGAYPIHINNDEYTDLVILRIGKNQILLGGPECTFTNANKQLAIKGGKEWTTSFAATWEMGSAYPTLAFGNYVDRNAPGSPWGTCSDNHLIRPDNNGQYQDVIDINPSYCTLSILFTDWNKSGEPSLRVTNDRQYYRGGQEQLWQISPNAKPRQYSANDGWQTLKIWGMGIAETDINADGFPEYALTSMGDTKLQMLDDDAEEDLPIYRDIAFERGATAHRPYTGGEIKPSTGWHAQFNDINNDTRTDLFIAKGNVEAMSDFATYDPDNMLLGNLDGQFVEKGTESGIDLKTNGRGAIIEDFNADGLLDILVINRKANINLFRNLGTQTSWGTRPMGNWLKIELDNGDINKSAIGAKISVKTGNLDQTKTLQIGGGHASGQSGFSHFGLGVAERAIIRIQWPNGDWSHPYRVFANNHVIIERDATQAKYWYPSNDE